MPYKYPAGVRGYILPLLLNNFSGGWNPRDAPSEIADTETPNCLNVTLDERGGVVKRLGLSRLNNTLSGAPINLYYWKTGDVTFAQDGAVLKKTSDFTTWTNVHTFSTADRCAMCDFNGKLVVVHPIDKVAVYDGSTYTVNASSPAGSTIAIWQNKCWVSGDPGALARVYASKIGDASLPWDMSGTGDIIDVREKDGLPVTCLGAGQGMDISGRPGLMVFKADSIHRINDSRSGSTFGQYTTLHNRAGAASSLAVRSTHNGQTCFISHRGIFLSDGVNTPQLISDKLNPFFTEDELNLGATDKWCAGIAGDRIVFSLTRGGGQVTNNFSLEYSPAQGWIVPHSFGCSAYTEDLSAARRRIIGGSPTAGRVFEVFATGADDGVAIASRWQSRWFEPAIGYMIRMRQLMVTGRGDFQLFTKGDYTLGEGVLSHFVAGGAGGTWGSSLWGAEDWGAGNYETFNPFFSLGVARSVAFELRETSSVSVFKPPLNEDGSAAEVGNFALYGLKLNYVRLGYV